MKKLKELIIGLLVMISVLALNPIGASAEWKKDSKGWWHTEGNSYNKSGWSLIDGSWYYFDHDGYILHDTIIDGYYLNSNGAYINEPSEEIKKYENLLKDKNWIKNTTNKTSVYDIIIVDLNKDGISEMIFKIDSGSGAGGQPLFVVTYNNGNINAERLESKNGGYYGYSSSENVFFISGGNHGVAWTTGYKLVNNHCEEVYSCSDDGNRFDFADESLRQKTTFYANGKDVTREEYINSFKKFGNIDKSPINYGGIYSANLDEYYKNE